MQAMLKRWCPALMRCLLVLCLAFFTAIAPVYAQDQGSPAEISKTLDTVRAQIDALQNDLDAAAEEPLEDSELLRLRDTAQEASKQAQQAESTLEPLLASMQARLAELGEPATGITEAPDVATQRRELSKNVSLLDAQIKLARLIDVEAGQANVRILQLRRAQFQAELGKRSNSVLDDDFWGELRTLLPQDINSLKPVWKELKTAAQEQGKPIWLAVLLGIAVIIIVRKLAGRLLWTLTTTRVAPGRLRRSLYATAQLALATVTPGAIAEIIHAGINAQSTLPGDLDGLLNQATGAAYFAGFVTGLGRALLSADRPTWRLISLPDPVASGLRWYPAVLAITLAAGWMAQKLATLVNASLAATVVQNSLMTLILGTLLAHAMRRATRLRRPPAPDPHAVASEPAPAPMPAGYFFARGLVWTAVIISFACLALGYIALGSFISRQTAWVLIVLGSAYLLNGLIEDGSESILAAIKRNTGDEHYARPMTRVRSQVIVLLAGAGRLLVLLLALVLLAAPFGDGPAAWLQRLDYLHNGIAIGEIQLRPATMVFALVVLLIGFAAVKIVQVWLARQYLPTTSLDPGMRLSAATLFGYAGYVLVIALSLSAVGIGLERVAWIASALSVGIGFGLQAVVQNFVSGLILLAERPVKVGDWVTLSGVEGDIRRINVRATEIQMADYSTIIVPNSEFITKIVRNVTHENPLGRVQIKLALPLDSNADQVHDLILAAFTDNMDILDDPAPDVMLEGVETTGLIFNATGYVHTPRAAYRVRSALLFELLRRFKANKLTLINPPAMVLKETYVSDGASGSGIQSRDSQAPETDSV
ncbi:mechanosensitive ion channel family protein [Pusillimonas harenae]|uniref:Mechanosensitive ion channel family protein n=2 Tax=Pollutimonas harenae TaxID=657015 RepID=A0A853H2L7_9BURK|nr:mechanosensitive ion channel family protein [Pollutimonas harenae]TEA71498.1 DUF3772 domain-containing protein [Pollutimonas harenae]